MITMVRYEIKKVLDRPSGRIALLLFACVIVLSCWLSAAGGSLGIIWVNEQGEDETGMAGYRKLREAQNEWEGYLDEEHLADIIRELNRIAATPEAQSDDYRQNDIAYSWKLAVMPVRDMLNEYYGANFTDFNWYLADTLSPSAAGDFYFNRVKLLKEYLYDETSTISDQLSEREKQYVIGQYEELETPIYYEYKQGWYMLLEESGYIMLLGVLIMGYLVAGIFSNEFKWKSDAVYFSTAYGRNKAIAAKIKAGFLLVTVLYWGSVLIFTLFTLCYCGFDGGNCPIQFDYLWSMYNLTYAQAYLLYAVSSYIGMLFIAFLVMWVSAKTKSAVFAVTIPFILVFVPNFLENSTFAESLTKILGLLPDNLLDVTQRLSEFSVYDLGFTVTGSWPLLFVLYTVLTVVLVPVMYREFRRKQIS